MFKSPRSGFAWLLMLGTWAWLAPLPSTASGQGHGQQHRPLGSWIGEARGSAFYASVPAGVPEILVAPDAAKLRAGAPNTVGFGIQAGSVDAVSASRMFAYTLLGATVPIVPGYIQWLLLDDKSGFDVPALYGLGVYSALITVPGAARLAGGSFWRSLAGTGIGYLAGAGMSLWPHERSAPFLIPPLFALATAGITTAITVSAR